MRAHTLPVATVSRPGSRRQTRRRRTAPRHRLVLLVLLLLGTLAGALFLRGRGTGPLLPPAFARLAGQLAPAPPEVRPRTLEGAMDAFRAGEIDEAVAILRGIMDGSPDEIARAEARLALGNILQVEGRHADALPLLDAARGGPVLPHFARLLWVRAVDEGRVAPATEAAAGEAAKLAKETLLPAVAREEASYLNVRLLARAGKLADAAAAGRTHLAAWPGGRHLDDARWTTADALAGLGRAKEAHALFSTLWHETPGSPFARSAKTRLARLEREAGIPSWKPDAARRRDFIGDLQRNGLHEEALAEIARLRKQVGPERAHEALLLQSKSDYALRRNDEALRAAQEIRRRFPGSASAPQAGLMAIKVLRRDDLTERILEWATWIETRFPGRPEARQARYDTGVHLLNKGELEAGAARLADVAKDATERGEDALWKLTWALRGLGRTDEARARVRELLARFPRSGYRRAALYWDARFAAETDREAAIAGWRALLREFPRDWYGYMAQDRLAALGVEPGPLGDGKAFTVRDPLAADVAVKGDLAVARLLERVGLFQSAAELLAAQPDAAQDPGIQYALARLHSAAGDTGRARRIVQQHFKEVATSGATDVALVPREFFQIVYPFRYRRLIEREAAARRAAGQPLDPELAAALIRSESNFGPHAISPVGAIGLMQLMPSAAAAIARHHGLSAPSREDLFEPETNIRFGTLELATRLADFDGEKIPAVCSYNAGVGPARKWWQNRPAGQEFDEFVETIPYQETRLYVKNVLADHRTYRWLYGRD